MSKAKVIVITGASSGIGEATARMLAKKGHHIILVARREKKLKAIAKDINEAGGTAIVNISDVTSKEANEKIAQLAIEKFGRIDVWVNNAGVMPISEISKDRIDEWEQMVDTNLKGTLYGFHAALPQMHAQHSGHFINIASVFSHYLRSQFGVYAATKFGIWAASETLRQEEAIAKSNVRVTVISPGIIDTELPKHIKDPASYKEMAAFYTTTAISAEEVARTIAFTIETNDNTTINEIILRPTMEVF